MKRFVFVKKAPNNAKYGSAPPNEGYINSWEEEDPPGYSDQEIAELEDREWLVAQQQKEEWLNAKN
jgi:hypothetical protein